MKQFLLVVLIAACIYHCEAQTSFCDKYAGAKGVNDSYLVGVVVDGVVDKALKSNLKQFFDGTTPKGSTDFTNPANAAKFTNLRDHLIEFFGMALGCTDGTIVKYAGGDLKSVHAAMPITNAFFAAFDNAVINTLKGAGVTDATDLAGVAKVLETTKGDVCNQADCMYVFCDKYALQLSLSDLALVGKVVDDVVTAALGTDLKQFFDGTTPKGSTDFTTNAGALTNLKAHLVQFFGAALGCTDGTIDPFAGLSLKEIHKNMPINTHFFTEFNGAVISVLKNLGVSDQADLNSVAGVLDSTKAEVCNQPDCTANTTPTAATDTTPKASSNFASVVSVCWAMIVLASMVVFF